MVKQSIFYSFVFLITITTSCNSKSAEVQHYETILKKHRQQTDIDLLSNKIVEPNNFNGLLYYPPNLIYKTIASVERINPQKVEFTTNTERLPVYYKYCKLSFKIHDTTCVLFAYTQNADEKSGLFIPFKDLTCQLESYAAGRYIEMEGLQNKDSIELDFNYAFNPYCHYNSTFSCPIVPFENHLKVHIFAGEKKLH